MKCIPCAEIADFSARWRTVIASRAGDIAMVFRGHPVARGLGSVSWRGRSLVVLIAIAVGASMVAACDSPLLGVAPVGTVQLSRDSVMLDEGEVIQLSAVVRNEDGKALHRRTVRWTSSEPAVAEIDSTGRITAVAPGETTITAAVDDQSAIAVVRVRLELRETHAGAEHSCGLKLDGTVYCWGDVFGSDDSRPRQPPSTLQLRSLSTSGRHTCGLTVDGRAYCWGSNQWGQLGDATRRDRPHPVPVATEARFESISAGWWHTCALQEGGKASCWGNDRHSQLGAATTTPICAGEPASRCSATPAPVRGGRHFASISAGAAHTCAVDRAGAGFCWGSNEGGQLGIDSLFEAPGPQPVSGPHAFEGIHSGHSSTCGLTAAGIALCWGDNSVGQLAKDSVARATAPAAIAYGQSFVFLDAGTWHACGVTLVGTVACWGENSRGQLGREPAQTTCSGSDPTFCSRTPLPLETELAFRAISAGHRHTCGVTLQNDVYCWGSNNRGQLGGRTEGHSSSAPVRVSGWSGP